MPKRVKIDVMVNPKWEATRGQEPILARAAETPEITSVIGTLSAAIKGLVSPMNFSELNRVPIGAELQMRK